MISIRPSKRVVWVLFACILALGAIIFASKYENAASNERAANNKNDSELTNAKSGTTNSAILNNSTNTELLEKIANLDDDGDGVKNWEEALAQNNSSNESVNESVPEENLSETDKFSREFFGKYIEAKQNGTLNQETLVQDLVENYTPAATTKTYSIADIKLATQNERAMREYGNNFGLILLNNQINSSNNEYEILNRAISAKSAAELEKLNTAIERYSNIVSGLRAMSVPTGVALIHVEILNDFEAIKNDVAGFKKLFSDPIIGLSALNSYGKDIDNLNETVNELKKIFVEQGIAFAQSEYGFALLNAI